MSDKQAPTISISVTDTTRDRLDYIQQAMGLHSRSAAVAMCITEVYDRLLELGHSRLQREQEVDK